MHGHSPHLFPCHNFCFFWQGKVSLLQKVFIFCSLLKQYSQWYSSTFMISRNNRKVYQRDCEMSHSQIGVIPIIVQGVLYIQALKLRIGMENSVLKCTVSLLFLFFILPLFYFLSIQEALVILPSLPFPIHVCTEWSFSSNPRRG